MLFGQFLYLKLYFIIYKGYCFEECTMLAHTINDIIKNSAHSTTKWCTEKELRKKLRL